MITIIARDACRKYAISKSCVLDIVACPIGLTFITCFEIKVRGINVMVQMSSTRFVFHDVDHWICSTLSSIVNSSCNTTRDFDISRFLVM